MWANGYLTAALQRQQCRCSGRLSWASTYSTHRAVHPHETAEQQACKTMPPPRSLLVPSEWYGRSERVVGGKSFGVWDTTTIGPSTSLISTRQIVCQSLPTQQVPNQIWHHPSRSRTSSPWGILASLRGQDAPGRIGPRTDREAGDVSQTDLLQAVASSVQRYVRLRKMEQKLEPL